MSEPFTSLDEAQMRVLAQYEYEGKLDGPITLDTVMEMHREVMRNLPQTPAAVFDFGPGDTR